MVLDNSPTIIFAISSIFVVKIKFV